jgi:hypothetical protein
MPVEHYRHEHELDTESLAVAEGQSSTAGDEHGGISAAKPESGPPAE